MKQFIVDRHTTPNIPKMDEVPNEKIPIYDSLADAEANLANLTENQIVATKDEGVSELLHTVDTVEAGVLNPVTSNAVAESFFKELWTNPSPTSIFSAQSITIPNLTDYRFIILVTRWATFSDSLNEIFFIDPRSVNNGEIWATSFDEDNNIIYNCDRLYSISGNTINIQDSALWTGTIKQADARNDLCIPYKILGIK